MGDAGTRGRIRLETLKRNFAPALLTGAIRAVFHSLERFFHFTVPRLKFFDERRVGGELLDLIGDVQRVGLFALEAAGGSLPIAAVALHAPVTCQFFFERIFLGFERSAQLFEIFLRDMLHRTEYNRRRRQVYSLRCAARRLSSSGKVSGEPEMTRMFWVGKE